MSIIQGLLRDIVSFSSDIVVISAITAIFASVGLFFGKSRLVAIILAFYPAGLIYSHFSYLAKYTHPTINTFQSSLIALGIFLVFFVAIYLIISNFISSEFSFSSFKKIIEAGALGITAASLTILFSYQVLNLSKIYNFSSGIDKLFVSSYFFYWLLAPLGILFLFRK